MKRILFVCTANICRSAMSEAILKKVLLLNALENKFVVESAGTESLVGVAPHPHAVKVAKKNEIDLSQHRGRQVTNEMIQNADLVLCLSENHKKMILGVFPEYDSKVFLLKEYQQPDLPENLSVDDPTGKSKKKYQGCFDELVNEISRILPSLSHTPTL